MKLLMTVAGLSAGAGAAEPMCRLPFRQPESAGARPSGRLGSLGSSSKQCRLREVSWRRCDKLRVAEAHRDILASRNPASPVYRQNLPSRTVGQCAPPRARRSRQNPLRGAPRYARFTEGGEVDDQPRQRQAAACPARRCVPADGGASGASGSIGTPVLVRRAQGTPGGCASASRSAAGPDCELEASSER